MKILTQDQGFNLNRGRSGLFFTLCLLISLSVSSFGALATAISLDSANYSVLEDGGFVSVGVTLQLDPNNPSDFFCFGECYQAIRITYATSDGTATVADADYTGTSGTITWTGDATGLPNLATQSIPLSITPDSRIEADELFNISITSCEEIDLSGIPSPCSFTSLISPTSATVTIVNDDFAGTVNLDNTSYSVNENANTLTVTATRTGGTSSAVTVDFNTSDGSAVSGQDYTATSGQLSWVDGEGGTKSVVIPIINDTAIEPSENFSLLLSNPSGSLALGQSSAAITILDDDTAGTVGLDNSTYSVNENGNTLTVTATRTGGTSSAVTVDFNTSDGSAVSGQDYTATAGQLSWADGEGGTKSVVIPIINDTAIEPSENFSLLLSNPSGSLALGQSSTAITILDDDSAGTVGLDNTTFSVNENAGNVTITASRTGGTSSAVTVDFNTSDGSAVSGQDYTATSGQLSWADGEGGTKSVVIPIINDTAIEPSENFSLLLSNPSGSLALGQSSAAITILDDDTAGTVGLDNTTFSVNENAGNVTITASRTGGISGDVAVSYSTANGSAISGQDYTSAAGLLSWADGEGGAKSVVIPIINDSIVETAEDFSLVLSNPSGTLALGQSRADITVLDDDNAGIVGLDSPTYSVNEKGNSLTITATRTGGSSNTVSVQFNTSNGSAVSGQDYTAIAGVLSWADGEVGAKSISIPIIADSVVEQNETFTLTLSNPTNTLALSQASATVTIVNQTTAGTIAFEALSYTTAEGNQAILSVTRTGGGDGPVTADFTTLNGTALSAADYSAQSGTLSWGDQDTAPKTITVATLNDSVANETNETFSVQLSNLTGLAALAAADTAVVTITNTTGALSTIPNLTPNQQALAGALDNACSSGATGEFQQLCNDLYSSSNATQILDSIIPEQIAAQGTSAIEFGFVQLQFLHGRIVSLRSNDRQKRFNILGFNVDVNGNNIPLNKFALLSSNNPRDGAASSDSEEEFRDSPLGFFLKGQLNIGDRNASSREKGYGIDTKGITFGADYRFTDELVMGMALGYGHTHNDFNKNQGDMTTESGDFSLYGSYFLPKDFYVDWILSYTLNAYDMERRISYPGFNASATSNPKGDQYGTSIGFGKDFYVKNFFFSPYTRIEYLDTGIDAYSERALGGVALAVNEQTIESVMSTLGGQFSQAISLPWGVLSPGLRAEWVHQFKENNRAIQARFISAPSGTGQFTILTDSPDRNYFNLGASLAATLPEGRSAFFRYETRVGQDKVSNHTLELGVRLPF